MFKLFANHKKKSILILMIMSLAFIVMINSGCRDKSSAPITTRFTLIKIPVKNIEAAVKFYAEVFGWKLPATGTYSKILDQDLGKFAFLDVGNNVTIELVEPKKGIWLDYLKKYGEGYVGQIGLEVSDINKFQTKIQQYGIYPVDADGNKIEKPMVTPSGGAAAFLLPQEKTLGTRIEVVQWSAKR